MEVVYEEHFEDGDGGYVADNTGGSLTGLWHYSVGRRHDGLPNHTLIHNWYYGAFETATGGGHYVLPADHQGTLTSPSILLPTLGPIELSFSYVLGTRPEFDRDFVDVFVLEGGASTRILSRSDGTLRQTGNSWQTAKSDLSSFAGKNVQLQLSFDTGDMPQVDPEGWYIDDVVIKAPPEPNVIGYKWHDLNGNGIWDEDVGETGLADWTVYVDLNNNRQRDPGEPSSSTDADGKYAFYVPDGIYAIREELKSGWKQSYPQDPDAHAITIVSGQVIQGRSGFSEPPNFGNWRPGERWSIRGYKWHDVDGDGVWDADEAGLNGWTIYLDTNNNGQPDTGEPAAVTANDGQHDGAYAFADLPAGTYVVREIVRDGWLQTYPLPPGFGHVVAVPPNVQGEYGRAEPPNFGNSIAPPPANYDWGDAPDSSVGQNYHYPTRNADDGARHKIVAGFMLGTSIDEELDGQPGLSALGDDINNEGDEDGVEFVSALVPGQSAEIKVHLRRPDGIETSFLDAWIDFNADGDWDEVDDRIVTRYLLAPGDNTITIFVPQIAARGATFARFRLSSQGDQPFDGPADDGEVEDYKVYIGLLDTNTVQFITPLSLFRPDGGELPELTPPEATPSIRGYKWSDLNQDGQWDADEPGMPGWRIYLDLNRDGAWNPESGEPSAVTAPDGSYLFANVTPGTYLVRELVPPVLATYPRDPNSHEVSVPPAIEGRRGFSEPPNFGGFDYAPFVRPADNPRGDANPLKSWLTFYSPGESDASKMARLLKALSWQTFVVTNSTPASFNITGIDKRIAYPGDEFVTIFQIEDNWPRRIEEFPLEVKPGESRRFFVSYRPGVPDWEEMQLPPHTFGRDDHLEVVTSVDGETRLDVRLVGGSTFDSDITYDGVVGIEDRRRLDDILAKRWPTKPSDETWDPTSDINARFRNGAQDWPEIGLGDFGPLNVELNRLRAPFLDLDWDNSSGQRGVGYAAEFDSSKQLGERPVPIADADAGFDEALKTITYDNTSATPTGGPRSIVFQSTASDRDFDPLSFTDQTEGNRPIGTVFVRFSDSAPTGPDRILIASYVAPGDTQLKGGLHLLEDPLGADDMPAAETTPDAPVPALVHAVQVKTAAQDDLVFGAAPDSAVFLAVTEKEELDPEPFDLFFAQLGEEDLGYSPDRDSSIGGPRI